MNRMGKICVSVLALALGFVGGPLLAAELSVLHGVNGTDIGQPTELPVDLVVDGGCLLTEVPFRTFSDPLTVNPGLHIVEVRLATGDCTGAVVAAGLVSVTLDEVSTLVAHLNADATIVLTKFTDDVRVPAAKRARSIVRHVADAPAVDVFVQGSGGNPRVPFAGVVSGTQGKRDVAPDTYDFGLAPAGAPITDLVIGPVAALHEAGTTTELYAVGSLAGGTLEFLARVVELDD